MQGGISIRGPLIPTTNYTNYSRAFECHPNASNHGALLLSLASVGVGANAFLAALIMARRSLRRWSSGLLLHGTFVDGARAALLIPLALSVLRCHPVTRCSLVDTAFLLLATVTSLNLLTASLSDAPLLPPPVLVPSLLQSAGYVRSQSNHYASPLYPKGDYASYYSDYYEEDANLLAETTAMPDSPQCVLFGTFMVWFAALTINLGPTFLSGALAAQADALPRTPSCPLVRGPARHVILNALWAAVNLLCVGLAAAHLRKLKKDLARARLGLLAAAGAGLAGMTGIQGPGYAHTSAVNADRAAAAAVAAAASASSTANNTMMSGGPTSSSSTTQLNQQLGGSSRSINAVHHHSSTHQLHQQSTTHHHNPHYQQPSAHHHHHPPTHHPGYPAGTTASELDAFLRQAQRNGRCHIRTLGTLAVANLLCWVPLYVCALVAPVGTGVWEDPAPYAYEVTLMAAFAHSAAHPVLLLILHHPLRQGFKSCMWEWCCFVCNFFGMDFDLPSNENSPHHSRAELRVHMETGQRSSSRASYHGSLHGSHHGLERIIVGGSSVVGGGGGGGGGGSHHGSHPRLHTSESLVSLKRSSSLKSNHRDLPSPTGLLPDDLMLPPPPPPATSAAFRKQVSLDDASPPLLENRW